MSVPPVFERFDVDCFDQALGVQLDQLETGEVVLLAFTRDGNSLPGPVERDGRAQVGDALLCIDEVPISLVNYDVVLQKLRASQRPISLRFGRTDESLQHKVRDRVLKNGAKSRQRQELARLREIEAERRQRERTKAQLDSESAAAAATATNFSVVYTAKDLAVSRFRGFPRSVLIAITLLSLLILLYAFGFIEMYGQHSDQFQEEAFMVQKADIDAAFTPSDNAHAAAQTLNNAHLRPSLRSSVANQDIPSTPAPVEDFESSEPTSPEVAAPESEVTTEVEKDKSVQSSAPSNKEDSSELSKRKEAFSEEESPQDLFLSNQDV